jgi:hypothetical protein
MKNIANHSYIIYKAQNEHTGEVYIGATANTIQQRKLDHTERANRGEKGRFQEAIGTYGPSSFSWKQIDTASSSNELAEKEKKYILQYNSKYKGYNSDSGGGFIKTVYQYNQDGALVASYGSLKEVQSTFNYDKRRISNACTTATLWKGSYWSYSQNNTFKKATDSRKKQVLQLSIDGEIIAKYGSVSEASKISGISKTCISRCCREERDSSGGFIWKYL